MFQSFLCLHDREIFLEAPWRHYNHLPTLQSQCRFLNFTLRTVRVHADPNAEPFRVAMGAVRIGATPSGSIPGRELPSLRIELG